MTAAMGHRVNPLPLTLSVPKAGRLLGLGRDASYAAAARGEIPTLKYGRRLVVPTYKLLELLGVPANSESAAATAAPIATTTHHGGPREEPSRTASPEPRPLRNVC